ncbi:craniofacial development protein 2-like [Elysia marginata]|uniref:Craniofacial development protein 2-like n=1 Tax=Elysia marginata TaxID=1093978 RepID=A0AAV4EIX2_9GAST|nr:craniofacial development protein 2-like [Elysia marginata]
MSLDDRDRNQIDFIISPKRFRNAILSSKSMPGTDCSSDHAPVMRIKLKKFQKFQAIPKVSVCARGLDSSVCRGLAPWPRGHGFEPQPRTVGALLVRSMSV